VEVEGIIDVEFVVIICELEFVVIIDSLVFVDIMLSLELVIELDEVSICDDEVIGVEDEDEVLLEAGDAVVALWVDVVEDVLFDFEDPRAT
jgi:hypothetical protein